jgi:hypothetical protein
VLRCSSYVQVLHSMVQTLRLAEPESLGTTGGHWLQKLSDCGRLTQATRQQFLYHLLILTVSQHCGLNVPCHQATAAPVWLPASRRTSVIAALFLCGTLASAATPDDGAARDADADGVADDADRCPDSVRGSDEHVDANGCTRLQVDSDLPGRDTVILPASRRAAAGSRGPAGSGWMAPATPTLTVAVAREHAVSLRFKFCL